ncbi:hypothetical protein [Streptomyces mirabilis]|jgi:hypothetical protein|uniref:Uncharacterized protein n=2 Tax=Streptomyces mirabilis TaxID=68239 RepID=A0ABU3V748_9ACTN|nr:hypothetical protein [Streptomyces mirabilis]MDU9002004.1 hypothetical protein [Streptomyces mirabilis]QDN93379.1 hypothetical protein FNV61_55725 [Streptomyces sp. RLB3-6]QDO05132.1 hypothetical protein FNV68_00835 [Streptomyces sp. S1D4-23]
MRTLIRAGALTAGASAVLLLAPAAHATAPGDNGTMRLPGRKAHVSHGRALNRTVPVHGSVTSSYGSA